MNNHKYLYSFNYDFNEKDLSKLESKYLFDDIEEHKLLFSNIKVNPSCSAFIKKRLDIITANNDYDTLITQIKNENIRIEGFKVEYLILEDDTTEYKTRLQKLRDIGHSISGEAQYTNPTITYGLCFYDNTWYFGELIKNSFEWHNHKQKPNSFSNSISANIAKSLLNIAGKGDRKSSLLDACCGVGTILLEGCFADYNIEGSDINDKICNFAQENLTHFNYTARIINADVADIKNTYDAAIIDLPYNLFTKISDDTHGHIITACSKLANRLVIVSTTDITDLITNAGFKITDTCNVTKKGKKSFVRRVWVCEKEK